MSELRDRIAAAIMPPLTDYMGFVEGPLDGSGTVQLDGFTDPREIAQAIIDQFDLTTNGEHGYVEIWGCYDTRFED